MERHFNLVNLLSAEAVRAKGGHETAGSGRSNRSSHPKRSRAAVAIQGGVSWARVKTPATDLAVGSHPPAWHTVALGLGR